MEDGVSKAEFPLPTNYYKLVIGTFSAFLLNVISRSFSTLQRNNLTKCHSAFRYCHRLYASEFKSCASHATLWEMKPHQGVFSRQMRSGVYEKPRRKPNFRRGWNLYKSSFEDNRVLIIVRLFGNHNGKDTIFLDTNKIIGGKFYG